MHWENWLGKILIKFLSYFFKFIFNSLFKTFSVLKILKCTSPLIFHARTKKKENFLSLFFQFIKINLLFLAFNWKKREKKSFFCAFLSPAMAKNERWLKIVISLFCLHSPFISVYWVVAQIEFPLTWKWKMRSLLYGAIIAKLWYLFAVSLNSRVAD